MSLTGWTRLPDPLLITGMCARPNMCAGCSNPISPNIRKYRCHFANKGFQKNGVTYNPCGTTYHVGCIRVGEPFRSRLPHQQGLSFPDLDCFPLFVCEACTVRSVLNRELRPTPTDVTLMKLERMRIIDMACRWAETTLNHYRSYFRRMREFEAIFGCCVLSIPELEYPPMRKQSRHYGVNNGTRSSDLQGDVSQRRLTKSRMVPPVASGPRSDSFTCGTGYCDIQGRLFLRHRKIFYPAKLSRTNV